MVLLVTGMVICYAQRGALPFAAPTLIKELRTRRPDIRVIFISGYAEDAFRKRVDAGEEAHFLMKPFTLKQLASKVKEVLP